MRSPCNDTEPAGTSTGPAKRVRSAATACRLAPHGAGPRATAARFEAGHDLLVRRLVEVAVGHPDAEERLDGLDANQLIRHPGQLLVHPHGATGTASTIRAAPWARTTWHAAASGRAGRDPVIDHDHGTAREARPRPVVPEPQGPTFGSAAPRRSTTASSASPRPVASITSVLTTRPHPRRSRPWPTRFERHAELAYEDDIESRVERQGDLEGHRDTAAGQPDDDDIGAPEVLQPPRQDPPGLGTIPRTPSHPPPHPGSASACGCARVDGPARRAGVNGRHRLRDVGLYRTGGAPWDGDGDGVRVRRPPVEAVEALRVVPCPDRGRVRDRAR